MKVRTPEGIHYWVIDPSTQRTAVPVDTWLATMGVQPGTFRQLTHEQLMEHLKAGAASGPNFRGFPMGEKLVWTTDPNTLYETDGPSSDPSRANEQLAEMHPQLSSFAAAEAVHETAAAVRAELAAPLRDGRVRDRRRAQRRPACGLAVADVPVAVQRDDHPLPGRQGRHRRGRVSLMTRTSNVP